MTANAGPLHSFNGVWDVYQVSFICFRFPSSFSPLFHHRFCLCSFTYAFYLASSPSCTAKTATSTNNSRAHTHNCTQLYNLCANHVNGGDPLIRNEGGYTKKGGRGELWKNVSPTKVRTRGGEERVQNFLILFLLFFIFLFYFPLFFLSHPMSKVKKDWSGMVAKKTTPVGALVFGVITTV
ncbi:hypothetical protein GGI35DRAFT_219900 [Trichoderma velutinum]